jgi:hypothetical protein
MSGGDELGFGIEGEPKPYLVTFVTEGGAEFIELDVFQGETLNCGAVEPFALHPRTSQPGSDGRFGESEDPDGGSEGQTFGQGG